MPEREHLAIPRRSIETQHAWRKENPDIRPDLHGALLMGTQLAGEYLHDGDLAGAKIAKANLWGHTSAI